MTNELEISLSEVVDFLRLTGVFAPGLKEVINRKVTLLEAQRRGISISDEELQRGADRFRIAKGLCKSEEMFEWLDGIGVSPEAFENFIETNLLIDKVKNALDNESDRERAMLMPEVKGAVREAVYNEWLAEELK